MNSGLYIQLKLRAWAKRHEVALQGSAGERGAPNYTLTVDANLFEPLLPSVRASYEGGAGRELGGEIPPLAALHSSAALAVNLFQYWIGLHDYQTPARLLDVPSTGIVAGVLEDRFPVCTDPEKRGFKEPPHLDFAFRYGDGARVGVECKLFEPYGRLDKQPLRSPYLPLTDAWNDIPGCRALAEQLATGDAGYRRLGAAQLLKHFLGLKFGARSNAVRLVYLYYDAPGNEAAEHRAEVARFQRHIAGDPVRFMPLTVQTFIARAVDRIRDQHPAYVDYLADRYL
jgi:hypothetical protein